MKIKQIELACQYAQEKHKNQKRKYTGEPYINHCAEVAYILCKESANYKYNEAVLCAAYLHDVVEDTDATNEDIERIFGKEIADLVEQVTDVSRKEDGNRKVRKEIDRIHLSKASAAGQSIKLADLISNAQTIVKQNPAFAKVYLDEKEKLLEVLIQRGDSKLFQLAEITLAKAKKDLDLYYASSSSSCI